MAFFSKVSEIEILLNKVKPGIYNHFNELYPLADIIKKNKKKKPLFKVLQI